MRHRGNASSVNKQGEARGVKVRRRCNDTLHTDAVVEDGSDEVVQETREKGRGMETSRNRKDGTRLPGLRSCLVGWVLSRGHGSSQNDGGKRLMNE